MSRATALVVAVLALGFGPRALTAQGGVQGPVADSIAVVGARRVPAATVIQQSGLQAGVALSFRDLQRAIEGLYGTGNYDDITLEQREADGRRVLIIRVTERPVLLRWAVRGAERISARSVRNQVVLPEGRPLDRAALERSRAKIDSLYRSEGYYRSRVRPILQYGDDSATVRVTFDVEEGQRVPVAQIVIEGNERLSDEAVAGAMSTSPEGFFWFQRGEFDEEKLQADLYERIPKRYGERGFVDFQVLGDSLIVDEATGKGTVVITVREGESYRVGTFEVVGNRRFSTEELETFYPFGRERGGFLGMGRQDEQPVFDRAKWDDAIANVQTLYHNNGYIHSRIRPDVIRRRDPNGQPVVDLRWIVNEGQPATIRRVDIVGNTVTHERVIRDALLVVPGDLFNRDRLIRSYQNLVNLGYFEQTMPPPDVQLVDGRGPDVDIIFEVVERRTGNINFGASVGQGTGLGGFLGLDEPNLFGRGKRGRLQWQFGRNINDIDLSYTDPAILGSRISGTLRLHNTRLRFTIADLGRITTRGASLQVGFPFFDRYSRVFVSYAIEQETFKGSGSNPQFRTRFFCDDCLRSSVGFSVLRDTRINLPFPTAGAMHQGGITFNGGVLGGTGEFQRVDLEGRWYAPLAEVGGGVGAQPVTVVLGFQTRSGFVFGDAGPFFRQLFAVGGTQFGIPLRGYNEFAITPRGFDPAAEDRVASPDAFGRAFFAMTGEVGLRLSQMIYVSAFFDAGNNWASPREFNPTRLFRGAGLGLSLISPLGPLGLDYAYGFDRVDLLGNADPGWKLHFKLGNIF